MQRRLMVSGLLALTLATALWGCSGGSNDAPTEPAAGQPAAEPATKNPGDFQVQTVYDQEQVAFRFMWKSHAKTSPAGFANVGQVYPGQFHDMMAHNGTSFAQLAAGQRMDEDRVSFMLEDPTRPVPGFGEAGCYLACHNDMLPSPVKDHYLGSAGFLDHWHWRGGRSGPMGYAEDASVDEVTRQRDGAGTSPSRWLRSGGDRLREDQAAFGTGLTGHGVLTDRLPRFVFNKGKQMPGGFQIPSYFLAAEDGSVVTNPYTQLPLVQAVDKNRSLLVVYQDRNFDTVDKVNAVDLGYLVYVAQNGQVSHLPAHLQDTAGAPFAAWTAFWAADLGIAAEPGNPAAATAAKNRLDAVHAEWLASGKKAMVTRSVGFIYGSDQHDITSARSFDAARGVWTVTLYRKLDTGALNKDTNLAALKTGQLYKLAFAIHDVGGGSETHHITFPYKLGTTAQADIKAQQVGDVKAADWNAVPAFLTRVFQPGSKTGEVLKDASRHPGAGSFGVTSCQSCHSANNMPALVSR
ncbi:MAG: hypothetical protein A2075_02465 [Geobacteraceae bacterium GWC2_58_44]|nr:MAG: hypothetical protein A2075_02465 [Geobacteraceae bacterium GWC2_58_44]